MIVAHGLTKRYGDKTAVDDLSFEVRPGVVTGFLGPNGAGKSTTMRLMLDLDYGGGQTRFDGRRFREIRHPMREIGTVLEARAFHPTRSARNHLRMLAAANAISNRRVDEVLALVGLAEVASKKPRGFSLGMAQRLGLAAALLGDPDTLILDEPANGLDPHGIQWLRDLLKLLASQGRTVFVSSHLLPEMSLMADELVVIGRGRLIASGRWTRSFVTSPGDRCSYAARRPTPWCRAVVEAVPTVEVSRGTDGTRCADRRRNRAGGRDRGHGRARAARARDAHGVARGGVLRGNRRDRGVRRSSGWHCDGRRDAVTDALRFEIVRVSTIRSTYWVGLIGLLLCGLLALGLGLETRGTGSVRGRGHSPARCRWGERAVLRVGVHRVGDRHLGHRPRVPVRHDLAHSDRDAAAVRPASGQAGGGGRGVGGWSRWAPSPSAGSSARSRSANHCPASVRSRFPKCSPGTSSW